MKRTIILITIISLLIPFLGFADQHSSNELSSIPEGLWLVTWSQSKLGGEYMWFPGSYASAEKHDMDSFYYFRKDGTGVYFSRMILWKENRSSFDVVEKNADGEYIEHDTAYQKFSFQWTVEVNRIILLFNDSPRQNHKITDPREFSHNRNPLKSIWDQTPEGIPLKDELIIETLCALQRIDPSVTSQFLSRYNIPE